MSEDDHLSVEFPIGSEAFYDQLDACFFDTSDPVTRAQRFIDIWRAQEKAAGTEIYVQTFRGHSVTRPETVEDVPPVPTGPPPDPGPDVMIHNGKRY